MEIEVAKRKRSLTPPPPLTPTLPTKVRVSLSAFKRKRLQRMTRERDKRDWSINRGLELDKPALVVRNNSLAMRVASRTSVDRKGELPGGSELTRITVHQGVAFPWGREHGRLCRGADNNG